MPTPSAGAPPLPPEFAALLPPSAPPPRAKLAGIDPSLAALLPQSSAPKPAPATANTRQAGAGIDPSLAPLLSAEYAALLPRQYGGTAPDPVGSQSPTSQPRATSWGRAAGLDARSLLTGAAGLAALPGIAMDNMKRSVAAAPAVLKDYARGNFSGATQVGRQVAAASQPGPYAGPQLSDFVHPERWQQAANYFADKVGLPQPATPGERVSSAAVGALPSAILAPEAPVAGALSAAAGSAASQGVKESGGSRTEQLLAGLAAGGLPTIGAGAAGLTRLAARGGTTGASNMRNVVQQFARQGMTPTLGQATGSRAIQALERVLHRLPGGAGVMERAAEAQREALASHLDHLVGQLGQGANVSPAAAGSAIESGLSGAAQQMKADAKGAYDKVDTLVPPATSVAPTKTSGILSELTTPAPGAEQLSSQLISPKVKALADAFTADMAQSGGKLPYSTLAGIKSQLGGRIDWSPFATDPENGALKRVWQAVRADMNDTAANVSPEAKQAVDDANSLYAANRGRQRILEGVLNKAGGPEAVYNSLVNSGKQGATKIRAVMGAVDQPTRNLVAAAVIKRMGLAPAGAQNAAGDLFSPESFLTNWNRMDPEARTALFGNLPSGGQKALGDFASSIGRLRQSGRVLSNPSGTGAAVMHGALGLDLLGSIPMAFVSPHAAAAELGSALGAAGGANVLARGLTSPSAVRWLARRTTAPRSLPAVIATQRARPQPIGARPLPALQLGHQGSASPTMSRLLALLRARASRPAGSIARSVPLLAMGPAGMAAAPLFTESPIEKALRGLRGAAAERGGNPSTP